MLATWLLPGNSLKEFTFINLLATSVGTCLSHHGQQEGAPCNRATDCDVGLICATTESRKSCQQPNESKKQYSKLT